MRLPGSFLLSKTIFRHTLDDYDDTIHSFLGDGSLVEEQSPVEDKIAQLVRGKPLRVVQCFLVAYAFLLLLSIKRQSTLSLAKAVVVRKKRALHALLTFFAIGLCDVVSFLSFSASSLSTTTTTTTNNNDANISTSNSSSATVSGGNNENDENDEFEAVAAVSKEELVAAEVSLLTAMRSLMRDRPSQSMLLSSLAALCFSVQGQVEVLSLLFLACREHVFYAVLLVLSVCLPNITRWLGKSTSLLSTSAEENADEEEESSPEVEKKDTQSECEAGADKKNDDAKEEVGDMEKEKGPSATPIDKTENIYRYRRILEFLHDSRVLQAAFLLAEGRLLVVEVISLLKGIGGVVVEQDVLSIRSLVGFWARLLFILNYSVIRITNFLSNLRYETKNTEPIF